VLPPVKNRGKVAAPAFDNISRFVWRVKNQEQNWIA
jgi:hypothetical protein